MSDVNQSLFDATLRHEVRLHKYANATVREINKLLDQASSEIITKIQTSEVGSFTRVRLEALLDAIKKINSNSYSQVGTKLQSELGGLATHEAAFQVNLLTTTIPVVLDIVTPSAELLAAAVSDAPFQGALFKEWIDALDAASFARARNAIRLGVVQGESVDQIVRRIRGTKALNFKDGALNISRRSAQSFVRTAIASVANQARAEVYTANNNIIKSVKFLATLDSRVCLVCLSLDGEVFPLDVGPRPPLHRGCRCTTVPITKSFRELGIDLDEATPGERASMGGTVPATTTFDKWIKNQSVEVQNEILGVTKAKLLRIGGLEIKDFVNNKNMEVTLAQLRATESSAFKKAGIAA